MMKTAIYVYLSKADGTYAQKHILILATYLTAGNPRASFTETNLAIY